MPVRSGVGREFLRQIVDAGGEGVMCKSLVGNWTAPLLKCKRSENFIVRVVALSPGQSVGIATMEGESRGHVALFGGKRDRVRIGSVLKLNGFGLTANGRIREPRVDRDTPASWLVQF